MIINTSVKYSKYLNHHVTLCKQATTLEFTRFISLTFQNSSITLVRNLEINRDIVKILEF